jgi:hypothetical protein
MLSVPLRLMLHGLLETARYGAPACLHVQVHLATDKHSNN